MLKRPVLIDDTLSIIYSLLDDKAKGRLARSHTLFNTQLNNAAIGLLLKTYSQFLDEKIKETLKNTLKNARRVVDSCKRIQVRNFRDNAPGKLDQLYFAYNNLLFWYCLDNNPAAFKAAMPAGVSIDLQPYIVLALITGCDAIANYLLSDYPANLLEEHAELFLHAALYSGRTTAIDKVCETAKAKHIKIRITNEVLDYLLGSGNPAFNIEAFEKRFGTKFDLNQRALISPIMSGNPAVVNNLLSLAKKRGINLKITLDEVNFAAWSGCVAMLSYILNMNAELQLSRHALNNAALSGNPEMLKELIRLAKVKHGVNIFPDDETLGRAKESGNPQMIECVADLLVTIYPTKQSTL